MSEFNPKLFKAQLQALLVHHGAGKMAHTPDGILADFLDHCLQAFVRAQQDKTLIAALIAPDVRKDDEQTWLESLLKTPGTQDVPLDAGDAPPEPEAVKVGPTVVKAGTPRVFKLPAVADQATIDALAIEIAVAPSPVMVQFMLDGEVQRDWTLGNRIEIGGLKYSVIGVLPDGELILNRIASVSGAPDGGTD